jgi:hypothetical protein
MDITGRRDSSPKKDGKGQIVPTHARVQTMGKIQRIFDALIA